VLKVFSRAFVLRRPVVISSGSGDGENNGSFRVAPCGIVPHDGASKATHYNSVRDDVKDFAAR